MKKWIFIFVCLCIVTQIYSQEQKKTTKFLNTWTIGANGGLNVYLAEGNNFFNPKMPSYFSMMDNSGFLGRLTVGYHFTPVIGVRSMLGVAQHYWPEIREVLPNGRFKVYDFGAENLTFDVLINLSNLIKDYNSDRMTDFSVFGGFGLSHRDKAKFKSDCFSGIVRAGGQMDLRIAPKLDLNVILEANAVNDIYNDYKTSFPYEFYGALSFGVTYHIEAVQHYVAKPKPIPVPKPVKNKELAKVDTVKKSVPKAVVPVPIEPKVITPVPIDPLPVNEVLAVVKDTFPVHENLAVVEKDTTDVEKPVITSVDEDLWLNIFYGANKRAVETDSQKQIIARVEDYLNANPNAIFVVTGHADSVGPEAINEKVSKERAQNTADYLINELGIPADKVLTRWVGERRKVFKQDDMNRLTTISTPGAEPFRKSTKGSDTTSAHELPKEVFFSLNGVKLVNEEQDLSVLDAAIYLRVHKNAKVIVCGYADNVTGSDEANIEVSKRRANTVANMLIDQYLIDSSRVELIWFGSSIQPYANPEKNRLVIIKQSK